MSPSTTKDSPAERQRTSSPAPSRWERAKEFLRRLYAAIKRNNVFNGAAALAYYETLAIFPALIFVMALIPYLPIAHVDQAILDLLGQSIPPRAAQMVSEVVRQVAERSHGGLLSLGLVGALWAASAGMYALMRQMNIAYEVEESRPFLRARATALGLTLLFVVLILGTFSVIVLGGVIQTWLGQRYGFSEMLLSFFVVFRWVVIVLALLLGLAIIYYAAPNRRQAFRLVTPGTVLAATMLIAASVGLRFYTTHFANYDATYGSIGAVILLMLWLYVAGLVLLIGAESNVMLEPGPRHRPPHPPAVRVGVLDGEEEKDPHQRAP